MIIIFRDMSLSIAILALHSRVDHSDLWLGLLLLIIRKRLRRRH